VQSGNHCIVSQGKEYTRRRFRDDSWQKLRRAAEDYLGEKVTEAVITVPAVLQPTRKCARRPKTPGRLPGSN